MSPGRDPPTHKAGPVQLERLEYSAPETEAGRRTVDRTKADDRLRRSSLGWETRGRARAAVLGYP